MVTATSSEFTSFFAGCEKIYTDYCDRHGYSIRDKFTFNIGKRYLKVVRGGSVHCFVDTTNGDVLKAAGWNAPAKGVRGNLFDNNNGLGRMGEYGPAYNK